MEWDRMAERELGTSAHSSAQSCIVAFYSYAKFPTGEILADYYEWLSARSLPFVEFTLFKTAFLLTKIVKDNPELVLLTATHNKSDKIKEYNNVFDAILDLVGVFEDKSFENMELFLKNTFSDEDLYSD